MNPIAYILAALIAALYNVALPIEPARAAVTPINVAQSAQFLVTYVQCKRTYHCEWKIKEDGRRVRRCHVCG
jgi:hypothetical protein